MEIVAEYGEISMRERYMMTARSAAKKGFKDVIGKVFQIKCACQTEDIVNGEGDNKKIKKILAMITHDGEVLAGDSGTTRESFEDLLATFGDGLFELDKKIEVTVVGQQSKAGRTFITLQLV